MKLTTEQKTRLAVWLHEHMPKCPVCGAQNPMPGDIVSFPQYVPGGMAVGGGGVLALPVACGDCGFMFLIMPSALGLP